MRHTLLKALIVAVALMAPSVGLAYAADPLPSWNDSAAKKNIVEFVGKPVLVRLPELNFIDDRAGKPVGINSHIGRRPIAAFGNSDGDREMLEWTQAGGGARLMMLVHHDDAGREWAYGAESKIGTLRIAWAFGAAE